MALAISFDGFDCHLGPKSHLRVAGVADVTGASFRARAQMRGHVDVEFC